MKLVSDLVGMGQLGAVGALFGATRFLPAKMVDSRWVSVAGIWLGGSLVRSTLTKTGAFEVYYGQKLVWSSVKTHEPPTLKDLIKAFDAVGVKIKA